MRTKRVFPGPRRPRGAAALAAGLFLVIGAALGGCSGTASSSVSSSADAPGPAAVNGAAAAPAAAASGTAGPGLAAGSSSAGSSSAGSSAEVVRSGQQLIETAQLSVRAASVSGAVSRATAIVTAAGGYVSAEQVTAGPKATATVTLKIPAAAYPATLAALSGHGLGTQLSLAQQAQDVTQQVADTSSRVASDQAAISQLRALLKRAGTVSALLSVQNQINAQESDLESMLAQQSALNHETSYATVTLTLTGPQAASKPGQPAPPPGIGAGLAGGWHALRVTFGWLVTVIGAVAPFAAVLALAGGLVWWVRRRLTRRRNSRPEAAD
jgi:Domain of unknown function (DUF4349)